MLAYSSISAVVFFASSSSLSKSLAGSIPHFPRLGARSCKQNMLKYDKKFTRNNLSCSISFYLASPQGQDHHNIVSQLLWARITEPQGYFQAFLSYYLFFESKIEFFKERNKFSACILAVSLDSFLDSSMVYLYG